MTTMPKPPRAPRKAAAKPAAPTITAHEDTPMNDTIKTMTDDVQTNAKAAFTKMSDGAKDAMEKGKKVAADAADFHKGNLEAMVESTRIAAKGFETMVQQRAAFAKQSFDTTAATMKSLVAAGSPTEFFRIQGDYVRTSVDAMVGELSRSTEASLKLAGEIAQPIQNRLALAADRMKVAA